MARRNWLAQVVLDYAEALGEMWSARGHWSDARQGYAWACDAAQAHDDDAALAEYLRLWGRACIEQGDYAEAHKHLQAAWQLSQKLGNILNAAKAASQLAHIAIEQTDWVLAEELLTNSLSVCEEHRDWLGVAEILYRQARVHYYRSEDALALSAAQRAWSLIAEAGQHRLSVAVLCMLADIATYSQRDYGQAESYAQQALRLAEASHDDSQLPSVLVCLADIHRKLKQFTSARQEAERSMALVKRMGDRKTQAQVWHCLSRIDHNCGQYPLALMENDEGLRLCRELNDRLGEALMLEHRGHVLTAIGKQVEARRAWSEALILAEALRHPLTESLTFVFGLTRRPATT